MRYLILTAAVVFAGFFAVFFLQNHTSQNLFFSLSNAESSDPAIRAGLAPHRAVYNISMTENRSGSQIINVSGKMVFEWTSTCDAWVSKHDFDLYYDYADTPGLRVTSSYDTYEPFSGESMTFATRKFQKGRIYEEIRGQAIKNEDGSVTVNFNEPAEETLSLPKSIMFPTQHTIEVISRLDRKGDFMTRSIYDGSDLEGPVEISAFIGKKVPADTLKLEDLVEKHALLKSPAHRARLSFFPPDLERATAEYQMDINLHENGVISNMIVEYDEFTIQQALTKIQPLERQCEDL